MKKLAHKTVVITGGAAGIGREMAFGFAREKANLAILDIDNEMLDTAVGQIQTKGIDVRGYCCDVSDPQMVEQVAGQVRKDFITVDILVNNAGIVVGKPAAEVSYEELRRIVEINVLGVMWMTRQFIGDMMAENSGHIVNIASASGLLAVPRLSDYCATKFAVVGYSDALRMEMKKFGCPGVKVSCICPSVIDTGMFMGFTPPLFNPLLEPENVARQIIQTVKREKDYLKIPFMVKMIPFFKLLPAAWVDRLVALTGTNRAMDHFVGH
ncbi:MAG: SDR family oxidoreductase [Desulfosarcina sp.]|nr:SDR family oxidoreductase [Desulfosarcina sp.]MBC2744350.1 SDR family oxidoreductase [Desulfosarcina sp.]MBC2767259.1 SDR family oxidoreductase [Desulfosarcina sp.]